MQQLTDGVRTESILPDGLLPISDIVGNSINAPMRRGAVATERALSISWMNQAPMLCPTRITFVSGPYAASSSSRNSTCAFICAGRLTEEVSRKERSPPMKEDKPK